MPRAASTLSIALVSVMALAVLFCSEDPAGPDDLREELQPHGSITGVVCNTRGEPLRGVLVAANADSSIPDVSDSLGQFTIGYVTRGSHTLRFTHRDWEDSAVGVTVGEGEDVELDDTVTLRYAWYMLRGTVTHEGKPVDGAGVAVAGQDVATLTDADGEFLLRRVPKLDSIRLICARDPDGFRIMTLTSGFKPDDTTAVGEIPLTQRGGTVQGTVYDLNGYPLPWVVVTAVGGGVYGSTDAEGRYVLRNVPTNAPDLRISVVTRDSSLAGAVSGVSVDSLSVVTGVDIRVHRVSDYVNGMVVSADNAIVSTSSPSVALRAFAMVDDTTVVDEFRWEIGGHIVATGAGQCTVSTADIGDAGSIAVRAVNTRGELSGPCAVRVSVRAAEPVIGAFGASTFEYGALTRAVTVNLGEPVYFYADVREPILGIDSCWWHFGDGLYVATAGVFSHRLTHTYRRAGTYTARVRAVNAEGAAVIDTLSVTVNTPPRFAPEQVLPTSAVARDTLRVPLAVTDADSDSVAVRVLQAPDSAKMVANTFIWQPSMTDTGTRVIELRADDGRGGADTLTWSLLVTTEPRDNAWLDGISVSSGSLSPSFDSSVYRYQVSAPAAQSWFRIKPLAQDPNASVTVNGTPVPNGMYSEFVGLQPNEVETLTVVVTAQDRVTHTTYTVLVARDMGTNAQLAALTVSAGALSPAFDPAAVRYIDSVSYEERYLRVTPSAADPLSVIRIGNEIVPSGSPSRWIQLADTGADSIVVRVTAEDTTVTNDYTIVVHRRPSSSAFLSALSWTGSVQPPAFYPDQVAYRDTVAQSTVSTSVTATVMGSGTIRINGDSAASGVPFGPLQLSGGDNVISIEVTAADGASKKTYTLLLYREMGTSADIVDLSSPSGFSPAFASGTAGYTDTVEFEQTSYTVRVQAVDPNAIITVNEDTVRSDSAHAVPLEPTSTALTVRVTSEDRATTKSWSILVWRKLDVALAAVTLSSGRLTPVFEPETLVYACTLSNETANLQLAPTARSPGVVSITVNGVSAASGSMSNPIALQVGPNTISIVVSGSDGYSERTYTLQVVRRASGNANLSALQLNQGTLTPSFHPDTLHYTDTVDIDVAAVRVRPTREHPTATIAVNGVTVVSGTYSNDIPVDFGVNTISVQVTAGDLSSQKTYTVDVVRRANSIVALTDLSLTGGALSPRFDSACTTYTMYVPNEVTATGITPTALEPRATITVNGTIVPSGTASAPMALVVGRNTAEVVVTAMDGTTTRTYTVEITRHSATSTYELGLHVTDADTLKVANSPYHFVQSILVDSGASLVIEPGVVLEMDSAVSINVNGTLIARGTASDSIVFRAYNSMKPWGYLLFSSSATDVAYDDGGAYVSGSSLQYCVLLGGGVGAKNGCLVVEQCCAGIERIRVSGSAKSGASVTGERDLALSVLSSRFESNAHKGVHVTGAASILRMVDCEFRANGQSGLRVDGTQRPDTVRVTSCVFADNELTGAWVWCDGKVIVDSSVFSNNKDGGIDMRGNYNIGSAISRCVIAGNTSDNYAAGYLSGVGMRECVIRDNTSDAGQLLTVTGDTIVACAFIDNVVLDTVNHVNTLPASVLRAHNCGIRECTFLNNITKADIATNTSQGAPDIMAVNNYWGTTDPNIIKTRIYDWFDDNAKAIIDFEPYLTAPDPDCPDASWTPLP